jgi:alkylation response protein AidB-like acyl-CoA dehydrogenase
MEFRVTDNDEALEHTAHTWLAEYSPHGTGGPGQALVDRRRANPGCPTRRDLTSHRPVDLPRVRRTLGDLRLSLELRSLLWSHVALVTSHGRDTSWQGSSVKGFGSELQMAMAREAISIVGPDAVLVPAQQAAPCDGEFVAAYQFSPGVPIGGGVNEIQRNIIAQRGFGLARK